MADHARTVIAGAGLAGLRAAGTLRRLGYDGELTIVGDEPHLPYDRPPLSKEVLRGDVADEALFFDLTNAEAPRPPGRPATSLDMHARPSASTSCPTASCR